MWVQWVGVDDVRGKSMWVLLVKCVGKICWRVWVKGMVNTHTSDRDLEAVTVSSLGDTQHARTHTHSLEEFQKVRELVDTARAASKPHPRRPVTKAKDETTSGLCVWQWAIYGY